LKEKEKNDYVLSQSVGKCLCNVYILSFHSHISIGYFFRKKIMTTEKNERNEIALSSNYSGGCQITPLDNDALLKITDTQTVSIHGPSLFALKYRVIPCIVNRNSYPTTGTTDNAYFHNSSGAIANLNRGRKWCSKRQQGGMYHSTR